MKKKTLTINNDIFNPSISVLKKVRFNEDSLEFPLGFDAITDDEHKDLWPLLLKCNEASQWWIGDYLVNCEQETMDAKGKVTKSMKVKLYEYVEETTGYSRSYLKQMKSVAARIPKEKRTKLSFQHHYDAVGGCDGDPNIMFTLLKEAEKLGSTVSKFRTDIRTFMAGSGAVRQTINASDADMDFSQAVEQIQKLTTVINKGNLTQSQKDYIKKDLTTLIAAL